MENEFGGFFFSSGRGDGFWEMGRGGFLWLRAWDLVDGLGKGKLMRLLAGRIGMW